MACIKRDIAWGPYGTVLYQILKFSGLVDGEPWIQRAYFSVPRGAISVLLI